MPDHKETVDCTAWNGFLELECHARYCILGEPKNIISFCVITSPPIGGGRGIVMPMSVCLSVCLSVFSQNFKV